MRIRHEPSAERSSVGDSEKSLRACGRGKFGKEKEVDFERHIREWIEVESSENRKRTSAR
jgi:hypothetical protein